MDKKAFLIMKKIIAIASDHGGYSHKASIKKFIAENYPDIEVLDFGTDTNESVDYPDYASLVSQAVLTGKAHQGILICGTGIGISIAANRYSGIRAALCSNSTMARLTRQHNNANILALGERVTGIETALDCVRVFIETEFEGGRHQRRIDKIEIN